MRTSEASALTRRTFLRGTGIALALPWLETFAADSKQTATPKRFVSVYHPDGVGVPLREDPAWKDWSWFPRGGEKDFELTKVVTDRTRYDLMIVPRDEDEHDEDVMDKAWEEVQQAGFDLHELLRNESGADPFKPAS